MNSDNTTTPQLMQTAVIIALIAAVVVIGTILGYTIGSFHSASTDDPNQAVSKLPSTMVDSHGFIRTANNLAVTGDDLSSEQRVALVIGNSNYENAVSLTNPVNDANLMAKTLQSVNFKLVGDKPLLDADKQAMEGAIRHFGRTLKAFRSGGVVGLFYYSGHGMQWRGENYLIPVTADIAGEQDIKYELVNASFITDEMRGAGNNLNLVVLDACRNNNFGDRGFKDIQSGLVGMQAAAGTILAFSTQPGSVAKDGVGANSPYTEAFAKSILKPGVGLFSTLNTIGIMVKEATHDYQLPWFNSSPIQGEFYFVAPIAPPIVNNGVSGTEGASQPAEVVTSVPARVVVPPPPIDSGFSVAALVQEATVQDKWTRWQAKMQTDFDQIAALQGSAKLRRKAWTEFLKAYAGVNPYSQEDKRLRAEATKLQLAIKDDPVRLPFEPEMVDIPAGSFMMGSPTTETGRDSDEGPVHQVTVGAFQMGKYELTFAEYDAFAEATKREKPSDSGFGRGRRPVINISWDDAVAYTQWLSAQTGKTYRLPTEAEWEYAARAGTTTRYWWGDEVGNNNANCDGCGSQWDGKQTAPVGSFAANAYGLYDMSGNVWEWCQDRYHDNYKGAPSIGSAWESGAYLGKVLRGGSWVDYPTVVRSADRNYSTPGSRFYDLGVRVASFAFART